MIARNAVTQTPGLTCSGSNQSKMSSAAAVSWLGMTTTYLSQYLLQTDQHAPSYLRWKERNNSHPPKRKPQSRIAKPNRMAVKCRRDRRPRSHFSKCTQNQIDNQANKRVRDDNGSRLQANQSIRNDRQVSPRTRQY